MRKTTNNTPRRVIIAILAAAMTFSAVAAGMTPICAPVVVYAGVVNTQDNARIDTPIMGNEGDNVTITENGSVDYNAGNVSTNNGTITDNQNTGDVDVNNGTITTNEGTVTDNFGTVGTNNGTVTNNFGGTVGGTPAQNQYHSIGVSGNNINASYSGFTERNGTNYLNATQRESYVTLAPASGYSLSGTETTGPVTSPDGYTYQIFRDSANHDNFMLMIGTPSGNQVINLSAIGIISQLIGGDPTTPTSSESTGSSSNNDSTSESVSDSSGESGLPAGWTVDSDRIYRLILQSLRERQSSRIQKNSYNIIVGDNPSFDEKAVRALVDKASEKASWVVFTLNGKAYEIYMPSNITPEQREALINLLKQEPNGDAGPMRLTQLMNQVGIAAKVMEMTGRDLVYEFTGNQSFMEKTRNFDAIPQTVSMDTIMQMAQPNDTLDVTGVGPITSVQPIEVSQVSTLPAQVNQETTGTVAVAEQPSTLSGWTQEAERIYTLVDTAQKQSIQNGNSVAQVDLGDKPNFDEKATRSFIDKLNTSGADLKFTADGKAYNINVPAGTTVEQREALINLLKQEPNGEAGPLRIAQLMWQVGINVTFTERSGRDLVNEFTNNALGNTPSPVLSSYEPQWSGEPQMSGHITITEPSLR